MSERSDDPVGPDISELSDVGATNVWWLDTPGVYVQTYVDLPYATPDNYEAIIDKQLAISKRLLMRTIRERMAEVAAR